LKKVAQLEAKNINLGDKFLGGRLPDIHEHVDASRNEASALLNGYRQIHADFIIDNKLDEVVPEDAQKA